MSFRTGKLIVIVPEPPSFCAFCHTFDECRPYGPRGERICHDCAMKDPETTKRQMDRVLFGDDVQ